MIGKYDHPPIIDGWHYRYYLIMMFKTGLPVLLDPESLQPRGEDYPITKAVTLGMQVNL